MTKPDYRICVNLRNELRNSDIVREAGTGRERVSICGRLDPVACPPRHPWLFCIDAVLQFLACQNHAQPVRVRIVNRNRVAYFGIFLVLFCCTAVPLKAGGYGEYRESSYRALSSTTDSQRIFEQMIEQRDIKYGDQHTRGRRIYLQRNSGCCSE